MIEELALLKDYVPLFQTLIWLAFISIFFVIFKQRLRAIISILVHRIKQGSSIKAGPIEIGEELKNMDYANQSSSLDVLTGCDDQKREEHRDNIYKKNNGIFLTHLIYPSKKNNQKFDIYIYLIRHKSGDLRDIDKAEFFFGHMWGNQIYTEKVKHGIIGISTSAYAPFLCTCLVRFKNGVEIQLDRYIDFEISKIYEKID
jgi:prokaryotic YEATS domain